MLVVGQYYRIVNIYAERRNFLRRKSYGSDSRVASVWGHAFPGWISHSTYFDRFDLSCSMVWISS